MGENAPPGKEVHPLAAEVLRLVRRNGEGKHFFDTAAIQALSASLERYYGTKDLHAAILELLRLLLMFNALGSPAAVEGLAQVVVSAEGALQQLQGPERDILDLINRTREQLGKPRDSLASKQRDDNGKSK